MLQKDENQLFVSSVCDTSVAFKEVLSYLFNSSQTLSNRIWYFGCLRTRKGFSLRNSSGTSNVLDRKSTRLNSSHVAISYAVFCLKKNKSPPVGGPSGAPL